MDGYKWLIGIAVLCSAFGCTSQTATQPTSEGPVIAIGTDSNSLTAEQAAPLDAQDFFPDPLISASTSIQPLPVPNLIPPTLSVERVPQVDTGRPDPFASLNLTPTITQVKQPIATAPVVTVPAGLPVALPTVTVAALPQPQTTVLPLPSLLPANPMLPPVGIPRQSIPALSLAETIEVSGVVEVGGKKNVIVKVPDEHTSRYVTVGERIGNGKVLVKRVEMGLEPVVVLEQDGREIVRSIGASSALVGAL